MRALKRGSRRNRRVSVVLLALVCGLMACEGDDPGAPADEPEDVDSGSQFGVRVMFIPGTNKSAFKFYRWIPRSDVGFWQLPGHWEQMDHPPPGFSDGAAAAATSPGGSAPSGLASAGPTLGVFTGGRSESGEISSTLAYVFDNVDGDFTVTSMNTPRYEHEMTTLSDGRILVTGGFGPPSASVALAAAEVFDPVQRSFAPVGDMTLARGFHATTLLGDGRVFVSGAGFVDPSVVNTTEIFDPSTNTFTEVAEAPLNLWDRHAAVTLASGRVLLVGGNESNHSEFFDPATGTFSPGPDMSTVHGFGLTATRLVDGRVLVVGGVEQFGGIPSSVAELYDPGSNTWSLVGPMSTARRNHLAIVGLDGTVLIAGGQNEDEGFLRSSEIFDPATGTFTAGPDLPEAMVGGAGLILMP